MSLHIPEKAQNLLNSWAAFSCRIFLLGICFVLRH